MSVGCRPLTMVSVLTILRGLFMSDASARSRFSIGPVQAPSRQKENVCSWQVLHNTTYKCNGARFKYILQTNPSRTTRGIHARFVSPISTQLAHPCLQVSLANVPPSSGGLLTTLSSVHVDADLGHTPMVQKCGWVHIRPTIVDCSGSGISTVNASL